MLVFLFTALYWLFSELMFAVFPSLFLLCFCMFGYVKLVHSVLVCLHLLFQLDVTWGVHFSTLVSVLSN